MNHPQEGLGVPALDKRELLVDVWNSQANIVEVVGTEESASRIRRLREQRFTQAERTDAERLKRQIVYSENGGAYNVSGLYRPQGDFSTAELARLAAEIERRAGTDAWDRRRFPR
jgi:hypothetical protein